MKSSFRMNSLDEGYRALVIGASGALGAAFCDSWILDPKVRFEGAPNLGADIQRRLPPGTGS